MDLAEHLEGKRALKPVEQSHLEGCATCRQVLHELQMGRELEFEIRTAQQAVAAFARGPLPRFEGYEIIREIGRGGMGVVFEAVQLSLRRSVALKILPAVVHALRPESVQRFRAEAEAAARLQHPGIVPIYDFGAQHDCHYYAMELIRGQPLSDVVTYLANQAAASGATPTNPIASATEARSAAHTESTGELLRTLDVQWNGDYYRRVAEWMASVADALQYAHDCGVIHRDIKPANLMLCPTGRVLISDFGLAKQTDDVAVTREGQLLGTLRYMSPEQVDTAQSSLDARTDIYSLGITLYEMLALRPALTGPDDHQMIQRVLNEEPPLLRQLRPEISRELELICQKAMAKPAPQRYERAADLSADLRRYLSGEPILARRPDLRVRLRRGWRRYRVVIGVAVLAALIGTSVWSTAAFLESRLEQQSWREKAVGDLVTSGREHLAAGKFHIAIDVYTRALSYDDQLPYVYSARATAYAEANQWNAAIADLDRVLNLGADRARTNFRRGVYQWLKGDSNAALQDLSAAWQANPEMDAALVLGYLIIQTNHCAAEPCQEFLRHYDTQAQNRLILQQCREIWEHNEPDETLWQATPPAEQPLLALAAAEKWLAQNNLPAAERWYARIWNRTDQRDEWPMISRWRWRRAEQSVPVPTTNSANTKGTDADDGN
ncbi:MAG: Serine/threonine-protein kinase PknD [Phycisphaerae bacterium]|nr:Serine/threonine-protein kinase PknD [Phycisphaerae bacterium]